MRLVDGAVYRFKRTNELRYYRAAHTPSGMEFLYPIQVSGTRIADRRADGRRYIILYFMTKWGKLAASGYWLDPKQGFEKAYVTDATLDTLELITENLEELPAIDAALDDVLNRHNIELDMEVWGKLLDD